MRVSALARSSSAPPCRPGFSLVVVLVVLVKCLLFNQCESFSISTTTTSIPPCNTLARRKFRVRFNVLDSQSRTSTHLKMNTESDDECPKRTSTNKQRHPQRQQQQLILERRSVLSHTAAASAALLLTSILSGNKSSFAAAAAPASSSSFEYPPVTHKVYFNVRISRSDGTFYTHDDLDVTPENTVYYFALQFGLFGTIAPNHVRQFLRYVNVTPAYEPVDDMPLPSYGRSLFTRLDQSTGLLLGGTIPGLEVTNIGGGSAIQYAGRILPASLWVESSEYKDKRISHSVGKGLLTHKLLDLSPTFGITTRRDYGGELDSTHVVFGRLLPTNDDNDQFLRLIEDIPTYSLDRPMSSTIPTTQAGRAAEEVASAVFSAQREFFRGAAKTFGDTRIDKVYEGKLLRRVEVTKVGLL